MHALSPLALAALAALGLLAANTVQAQADDRGAPITLEADLVRGRPDIEVQAEGRVEVRRGRLKLSTERLAYDPVRDLARASGGVRIETLQGDRFAGRELELVLDRAEGFVLEPEYWFARTGAGGRAKRIDLIDSARSVVSTGDYTSCRRDGAGVPDWLLSTTRVRLDFEANEGIAEGAVLRFLDVPILALPVLSFPLTDQRKTGWLPPALNLDSKSGVEIGVPWYWNIAPQRDATLEPILYSKRGLGLAAEFRYLEPRHQGELRLHALPNDRVAGASRRALQWTQSSVRAEPAAGLAFEPTLRWRHEGLRVSDDAYWKDFSRGLRALAPRLMPTTAEAERDIALAPWLATTAYARAQLWQVLQDPDPAARYAAPYQRLPQLGWRGLGRPWAAGPEIGFEAEFNRFVRPTNDIDTASRSDGERAHVAAWASRSWRTPGAWITPRAAFEAAHYRTEQAMSDGRRSASRAVPTLSLDGGLVFERRAQWFGRTLVQTLEPRLRWVNTPFRAQAALPLFDSAPTDFNFDSLFSDNVFSGRDRIADLHQLTAGATSRWLDPERGDEVLRLGIAQRTLLRDQRITADGVPLTERLSDLLFAGRAHLAERWRFDATLQYDVQADRIRRSVVGARYTGGPFRVLSATYRFTRDASEQLDLGWQWPVYRGSPDTAARCNGTLYGVGRINYSMRDSRITDSLAGLEYDAGCWIGRVVAERLSTGRAQATTRLMFQLELVGLSRLGSNPLAVLKDSIPGYTLLRDEKVEPEVRRYLPR